MVGDWRWLSVCCHHQQWRLDIPWWIQIRDVNDCGDDKNCGDGDDEEEGGDDGDNDAGVIWNYECNKWR